MNKEPTSLKRRVEWRRVLAVISLLVILAVLQAGFWRPGTNYPGDYYNRGHSAAWLGVEWSMVPHTTAEIAALAAQLRQRQIDTIFVYVSYLKPVGSFNSTHDQARAFFAAFKQTAPQIEVQGWLGIPMKVSLGTPVTSGYVDLSDPAVQKTIANISQSVIQDLGFDGVHLDPETILSGNVALLTVLDQVRSAVGPEALLSISAREITPLLPEADWVFNRWVTRRLLSCGLRGVLSGLNDADTQPGKVAGVAIYPYWETTEDDWQTYTEIWLGQSE